MEKWVTIHGPSGQKVSAPLARTQWPSEFCMSRAVTSLAAVNPKMTSWALSSGTSLQMRPMTMASSPS